MDIELYRNGLVLPNIVINSSRNERSVNHVISRNQPSSNNLNENFMIGMKYVERE